MRRGILLAVCLAASACGSARTREAIDARSELWCDGTAMLVIRNSATYEIEIVELRSGSGARVIVGTFGTGRFEINIRPERDYSYAARRVRDGRWVAWTGDSTAGQVSLERECR